MTDVVETLTVRELLSVLVPLVAEGCAYDSMAPDGVRMRVVAVHQNRVEEEALARTTTRSVRSMTVSVHARGTKVGEVVVWPHAAMSAVEEALVVSVAERIADEIEKASIRREPVDAAVIAEMVGHELRGPLQALGLGLELLRTRVRDSADEVSREWILDRILGLERASKRLVGVADRVAEMARPATETPPLRELLDLEAVASAVVSRMREELTWAECTVTFVRENAASLQGSWDRDHLETVIASLLANAIKFGAKRPIEIVLGATAEEVTLRVRDHGCGIEPVDAPHVFERYYRGVTPSTLPGLGLGLALTDRLVRAHGGDVQVSSQPGEGASFVVRLPRGISAEPARRPSSSQPEARSR